MAAHEGISITNILVQHGKETIHIVSKRTKVTLASVPEHVGIQDNEVNLEGRRLVETTFKGLEPALYLSKSTALAKIKEWLNITKGQHNDRTKLQMSLIEN